MRTDKILHHNLQPHSQEPWLLGVEISPSQEVLWRELCRSEPSFEEMFELATNSSVLPAIRQRAILTVTAPRNDMLPFEQSGERYQLVNEADDKGNSHHFLRQRLATTEAANGIALGVLYWLAQDEESGTARTKNRHYERVIIELLPLVAEYFADQLFQNFTSRIRVDHENTKLVIADDDIPQAYRQQTLDVWLRIVEGLPSHDAQDAIDRLASFLSIWAEGASRSQTNTELFTKVVSFLEKNCAARSRPYAESTSVRAIADHVRYLDPELAFQFASRHLLKNERGAIEVRTETDHSFLDWLVRTINDHDPGQEGDVVLTELTMRCVEAIARSARLRRERQILWHKLTSDT